MENQGSEPPAPLSLSVGADLRQAREAAGFSRADIASQTKIAERHLLAIEEDRLSDLAARTYAVGFTRAYARSLGLDEKDYADRARKQLDAEGGAPQRVVEPSFEPGDPARVPSLRIVGWAAFGVLLVIFIVIAAGSSFFSPEGKLPSLLPAETASTAPVSVQPVSVPAPVATGPVVLTALENDIWLRVSDAGGAQLLQKTLAKGESWTVPAGADGPLLRTGRPDALQISVGGRPLPLLADRPMTIRDLSLAPTSLLGLPATTPTAVLSSPSGDSAVVAAPSPSSAAPAAAPRPQPNASRPARKIPDENAPSTSTTASTAATPPDAPAQVATPLPVSTVSE